MTIYEQATMLAGQCALCLIQDDLTPRNEIRIIPEGTDGILPGIYINPLDAGVFVYGEWIVDGVAHTFEVR